MPEPTVDVLTWTKGAVRPTYQEKTYAAIERGARHTGAVRRAVKDLDLGDTERLGRADLLKIREGSGVPLAAVRAVLISEGWSAAFSGGICWPRRAA